jgi:hypothetical protein
MKYEEARPIAGMEETIPGGDAWRGVQMFVFTHSFLVL